MILSRSIDCALRLDTSKPPQPAVDLPVIFIPLSLSPSMRNFSSYLAMDLSSSSCSLLWVSSSAIVLIKAQSQAPQQISSERVWKVSQQLESVIRSPTTPDICRKSISSVLILSVCYLCQIKKKDYYWSSRVNILMLK